MARYRGDDDFPRFPPSVPRKAEGGIRARSKRGAFAASWWGRRWIEVLEGFGLKARLQRGRRYARQGQVLTLEVESGQVSATVQGSRARPYRVEVHLTPFRTPQWQEVVEWLAADVRVGARLLSGEMPAEVEDAMVDAGVRLFPGRLRDLDTSCSCPDWSNPCKHIAAVHYLLAEELDRDPFLLFRLRGMDRESFGAALLEARGEAFGEEGGSGSGATTEGGPVASTFEVEDERHPDRPLWPTDPRAFWTGTGAWMESAVPPAPTIHAALIRRLGAFPFWRGDRPFLDEMVAIYRRASAQARALLEDEVD